MPKKRSGRIVDGPFFGIILGAALGVVLGLIGGAAVGVSRTGNPHFFEYTGADGINRVMFVPGPVKAKAKACPIAGFTVLGGVLGGAFGAAFAWRRRNSVGWGWFVNTVRKAITRADESPWKTHAEAKQESDRVAAEVMRDMGGAKDIDPHDALLIRWVNSRIDQGLTSLDVPPNLLEGVSEYGRAEAARLCDIAGVKITEDGIRDDNGITPNDASLIGWVRDACDQGLTSVPGFPG